MDKEDRSTPIYTDGDTCRFNGVKVAPVAKNGIDWDRNGTNQSQIRTSASNSPWKCMTNPYLTKIYPRPVSGTSSSVGNTLVKTNPVCTESLQVPKEVESVAVSVEIVAMQDPVCVSPESTGRSTGHDTITNNIEASTPEVEKERAISPVKIVTDHTTKSTTSIYAAKKRARVIVDDDSSIACVPFQQKKLRYDAEFEIIKTPNIRTRSYSKGISSSLSDEDKSAEKALAVSFFDWNDTSEDCEENESSIVGCDDTKSWIDSDDNNTNITPAEFDWTTQRDEEQKVMRQFQSYCPSPVAMPCSEALENCNGPKSKSSKKCKKKDNNLLVLEEPSSQCVGKLMQEKRIVFSWQLGSFVAYNESIGRVYYSGFHLRNKNGKGVYSMGDIVQITTGTSNQVTAQIVSCFQATKSYYRKVKISPDEYTKENVQERGYPYMEIRIVPPGAKAPKWTSVKKVENIPEWLQEKTLALKKVNSMYPSNEKPLHDWQLQMLSLAATLKFARTDKLILDDQRSTDNERSVMGVDSIEIDCKKEIPDRIEVGCIVHADDVSCRVDNGKDIVPASEVSMKSLYTTKFPNIVLEPNFPSLTKEEELVPSTAVDFSFLPDSFLAYHRKIGRIYYGGFSFKNNLMQNGRKEPCQFFMGDLIEIKASECAKMEQAQIVSCYHATKTFLRMLKNGKIECFQDKGYPYLEIRYPDKRNYTLTWSSTKNSIFPHDWLTKDTLFLSKVAQQRQEDSLDDNILAKRLKMICTGAQLKFDGIKFEEDPKQFDYTKDYSFLFDGSSLKKEQRVTDVGTSSVEIDCKKEIPGSIEVGCVAHADDVSYRVHNGKYLVSAPKLSIKSFVGNVSASYGWNKFCEKTLEEYQLVSYVTEWEKDIFHGIQETLTEDEQMILRKCRNSKRNCMTKIAEELTLIDFQNKPLSNFVDVVNESELSHEYEDQRIKHFRERLHYSKLNPLFNAVVDDLCRLKSNRDSNMGVKTDIILQAPCGSGKSSCFVVAAQILGGVTLVIEPLRALIDSQIAELRSRNIRAESLANHKDAKSRQDVKYCKIRLAELRECNSRDPLVLYCTPELFEIMQHEIRYFVSRKMISLIVVDEFDIIEDATESYRKTYLELIDLVRDVAPNVQLFFLSATFSRRLLGQIILTNNGFRSRPKLFQSLNPLTTNHVFKVVRKLNNEQVAKDITSKIGSKKCVCYCLTKSNCRAMKEFLMSNGIKAEVYYTGGEGEEGFQAAENERILNRFNGNSVQVLCATKALGRGVHLTCPVRFVIHTSMPTSLTDYIQETGRGGRDGKETECILYYRDQDKESALNVLHGKNSSSVRKAKSETNDRLEAVRKYALEGKVCRYVMLAGIAVPELNRGFPCRSAFCDNCRAMKRGGQCEFEDVNINRVLLDLLKRINGAIDYAAVFHTAIAIAKEYNSEKEKWLVCALLSFVNDRTYSLLDLLLRQSKITASTLAVNHWHREDLIAKIQSRSVSFCLRNLKESNKCTPLRIGKNTTRSKAGKIVFVETYPPSQVTKLSKFPFIIQYEISRLRLSKNTDRDLWLELESLGDDTISGCEFLYKKVGRCLPSVIRENSSLFFSCELNCTKATDLSSTSDISSKFKLKEPQRAYGRRIFRHFGADRFLEVSVASNVEDEVIIKLLKHELCFCGRVYRFLWCKKDKSPQSFMLFAERGTDIPVTKELTVEKLMESCLPRKLNPSLTKSQYSKRMKLCFSTTTEGPVISQDCVSVLPNFELMEVSEIDGAGLISKAALNLVWQIFKENGGPEVCESLCYSGFQGRIGGFKGVWVLDPSLGCDTDNSIVIQCRESQMKYNSLGTFPSACDPSFQNTVEVCSWNKRLGSKLNTRIIQALEHLSSTIGRREELKSFLLKCMNETIMELDELCADDSGKLLLNLQARNKEMIKDSESNDVGFERKDNRQLFRMASAGVSSTDPEFRRRKVRLIEKIFGGIRDEAHYPIPASCTLRMVPDHTLLLEEGEVFLALSSEETRTLETQSAEIIAMRSPSYFAGDVRRLKIVTIDTLTERAERSRCLSVPTSSPLHRTTNQKLDFFKCLSFCLVLSNKGQTSEASRMSGGDYDGDNAWICWNDELLSCLPSHIEPNPFLTALENAQVKIPSNIDSCIWNSTIEERVQYDRRFRYHLQDLGKYAELLDVSLDKYGFDHDSSIALGKAAYIQVDVPYRNPFGVESRDGLKQFPHWKKKKNSTTSVKYQSTAILGEMWTLMNNKMNEIRVKGEKEVIQACQCASNLPPNIVKHLSALNDDHKLEDLRSEMKNKVLVYMKERAMISEGTNDDDLEEWKKRYFEWKIRYCESVHTKILSENYLLKAGIASVLYEQCRRVDAENYRNRATEFAWYVFEEELLQLSATKIGLIVATKQEAMLYRR